MLDLRSAEMIARLLDRGELESWRELYRIAGQDADLRRPVARVVERVPLAYVAAGARRTSLQAFGLAFELGDSRLSSGANPHRAVT
jgi:hypothetical protein